MNFKITKKGYDIKEVEKYINDLIKKQEIIVADLRVQVSDLKAEIANLKQKLDECKQREDIIKNCIIKAQEKADEMEYTSKVRFALEGERLKMFQDRCNEELLNIEYKLRPNLQKEIDEYLDKAKKEIDVMFRSEFRVKDFIE